MVKDVATKINEMTLQINDANNKLKLLMETPDKIYEQIEYLTRGQAAKYLGVSKPTIDKYVKAGKLQNNGRGQIIFKSVKEYKHGG